MQTHMNGIQYGPSNALMLHFRAVGNISLNYASSGKMFRGKFDPF